MTSDNAPQQATSSAPGGVEEALQQWMDAISAIRDPIFVHDIHFRIVRANPAYIACAGMPPEAFIGRPYWEVFPKGDGPLPGCAKSIRDHNGEEGSDEVAADGRIYHSRAAAILGRDGEYRHSVHIMEDITARKQDEARLRLAAQVFNATAESIMILDADQRVIDVNRAFTEITGYSQAEVIGRLPWQVGTLLDREFLDPVWPALRNHDHWRGETRKQCKNGDIYAAMLNVSVVRDEDGRTVNYILMFSDITDIKTSQEYYEYLANHDLLTGLPNRNLFYDRLQHGLDKAFRGKERLAVMFIDLDNFKTINDSLGHELGDKLLTQAAERLRACTRKEDTIARLGGDEFTVIAEDIREPEYVVSSTALRIIQQLSQPFQLDGHEALISASIGIAFYPDNGDNLTTLLKNADSAMYQAKQMGKNNYQFFTEEINISAKRHSIMERDLRQALKNGDLFLAYQPQIDLATGRIKGLEALLRWNHAELGLIPPEQFIPVAEASGLIHQLGDWVLRAVCGQIQDWSRRQLNSFRVGVNLSSRQFLRDGMADSLRRIIAESGIHPDALELEMMESALMDDINLSSQILGQLKEMGIQIAIDDFGMGYSSLNKLRNLPLDHLKIGRNFINSLISDSGSASIVSTIISMGHSLHLKVIAEGVETQEQLEHLQALSCDEAQGFYLSRPLPAESMTELLSARQAKPGQT